MKKMNFAQMEVINGGQTITTTPTPPPTTTTNSINWCSVGKGITGIGGVIAITTPFTCGLAAALYTAIAITTVVYC